MTGKNFGRFIAPAEYLRPRVYADVAAVRFGDNVLQPVAITGICARFSVGGYVME